MGLVEGYKLHYISTARKEHAGRQKLPARASARQYWVLGTTHDIASTSSVWTLHSMVVSVCCRDKCFETAVRSVYRVVGIHDASPAPWLRLRA